METEFMGGRKAKIWTYLFLGVLLVVAIVVINLWLVDPAALENGLDYVAGLPSWAVPAILFGLGAFLYWLGLKVETDWPEFLGATLIAAAAAAGMYMVGWGQFELGGLAIVPYLIPVAIFLVLLIVAMAKSK